jgi:hypothetical protein
MQKQMCRIIKAMFTITLQHMLPMRNAVHVTINVTYKCFPCSHICLVSCHIWQKCAYMSSYMVTYKTRGHIYDRPLLTYMFSKLSYMAKMCLYVIICGHIYVMRSHICSSLAHIYV